MIVLRIAAGIMIGFFAIVIFMHDSAVAETSDHSKIRSECEDKIWPDYTNAHNSGTFPFATFEDETLCLGGAITDVGATSAIKILNENSISRIIITSGGGDAFAALRISMQMLKYNIDVYVFDLCASSCANYIFLAGKHKFIQKNAVVAWHGAPSVVPKDKADMRNLWEFHKIFFHLIGVDDRLTYEVPCDVLQNPAFLEAADKGQWPAWTYKKDVLFSKFHVSGIHTDWDPQSDAELRAVPEWGGIFQRIYLSQGLLCKDPAS